MNPIELEQTLHRLGQEWLNSKIQRMTNLLKIALPDEAVYREIMLSLGYPKNKVQFLELALLLPYSEIKKLKTKELIEKGLLYRAGFSLDGTGLPDSFDLSLKMDKSSWVFKSTRPVNFPDRRTKDFSQLLSETTEEGIYNYFKAKIEENVINPVDKYSSRRAVENIMAFKGIGIIRKKEMFFNIILPFFLADEQSERYRGFLLKIFETHPPLETNSAVKSFYKLFPAAKAYISTTNEYFGALDYARKQKQ
ncbi:MAG: DUF2851 family protein [Candidatus Saccharicenans sp.]|uniref:DUF2851 family protein n=1 Tax=Candidatus Saccharicenans sp. TaxID=2819258 RepID=UPI0040493822